MEKIDKALREDLIQKNVGIKIRELRKAGKILPDYAVYWAGH